MSALTPWIQSARFDLTCFFGGSALALLLGSWMLWSPPVVVVLWWVWLLLFDGPHLLATWSRTVATANDRQRWGALVLWSLLWFLPGFLALGASVVFKQAWPFELFLLCATMWSIHHNTRQHYGVLAIYHARANTPVTSRQLDRRVLHLMMWGMFGVFVVGHPYNRKIMGWPQAYDAQATICAGVMLGGLSIVAVAWLVDVIRRVRAGQAALPCVFMAVPVLLVHGLMYGIIGVREPVLPGAQNAEQYFMAVAVMMGLMHSTQYLGIIATVNRQRAQSARASWWDGRLLLGYGVMVAMSALYLLLNAARGVAPQSFFDAQSLYAKGFLALYWGIFFHHYYVDQWIWKVSRDAHLRADLKLG